MTPLAVIQSGVNDAAHATLWVVLVALTGLVASFASVWRSFVIPKEALSFIATVKELAAAGYEPDDDGEQLLAERVGFGIRRRGAPGFGFNAPPSSLGLGASPPRRIPAPPDHIADRHAAALASAFSGHLRPIADAIRTSTSADDCLRRVSALAVSIDPTRAGEIIAQAFAAYAAAGHNTAML